MKTSEINPLSAFRKAALLLASLFFVITTAMAQVNIAHVLTNYNPSSLIYNSSNIGLGFPVGSSVNIPLANFHIRSTVALVNQPLFQTDAISSLNNNNLGTIKMLFNPNDQPLAFTKPVL